MFLCCGKGYPTDSDSERPIKRKPFANFVKKLGFNRSGGDQQQEKTGNGSKKSNGGLGGTLKHKKNATWSKNNNPYPESGHIRPPQQSSQPSFGESARQRYSESYSSLPISGGGQDREEHSHSNKSGAPTLATNPETVHSDAGHSRAATTTTGVGALSTMDCAGAGSTFSSPNHSDHSLATTLTTIQSQSNAGGHNGASGVQHYNHNQPIGSQFTHQYPVSPSAASAMTASAIPRHLQGDANTFSSTNSNSLTADNASIMTLASSSKRRRRSMDSGASVRALAPSSNFGGSRESLPLSVLSANIDPPRHSVQASSAAAERASVYSASGLGRDGIASPVPPSERNSYYAKQAGDAKSLRSITNLRNANAAATDASSITGIYPRSEYEAKRDAGDVASLRSVDATKSVDHTRNNSIGSPVTSHSLLRQTSIGGATALSLSRRSSDWRDREQEGDENEGHLAEKHE